MTLILVDLVGIEPTTSSMPWKRAPSCATGPLSQEGSHRSATRLLSLSGALTSNRARSASNVIRGPRIAVPEAKTMNHKPVVRPVSNKPTGIILTLLLIALILVGVWLFLQREGKHRSNPTQGHTSLVSRSVHA